MPYNIITEDAPFVHDSFGIKEERAIELCEIFNENNRYRLIMEGIAPGISLIINAGNVAIDFLKGATTPAEEAFCLFQAGLYYKYITADPVF